MSDMASTLNLKCPVCGRQGKMQFTSGKGKPYIACDEHKLEGLLVRQPRQRSKPWLKRLWMLFQ